MNNQDTEKILQFLTEKWGDKNCSMCSKGPWEVQKKIFQLSEFHEGNLVVGGLLIPVIPVTCTNCGHTVLVNALISGAITPETTIQKDGQ
jgi:hypothetical protein